MSKPEFNKARWGLPGAYNATAAAGAPGLTDMPDRVLLPPGMRTAERVESIRSLYITWIVILVVIMIRGGSLWYVYPEKSAHKFVITGIALIAGLVLLTDLVRGALRPAGHDISGLRAAAGVVQNSWVLAAVLVMISLFKIAALGTSTVVWLSIALVLLAAVGWYTIKVCGKWADGVPEDEKK